MRKAKIPRVRIKPRPGDENYVGKGHPPKKNRFKPGQSGNPTGRRKGSRNLSTIMQGIIGMKVPVTENGKTRKLLFLEAVTLRLAKMALNGDHRAIATIFAHAAELEAAEARKSSAMSQKDTDLLDLFVGRIQRGAYVGGKQAGADKQQTGKGP